MGAYLNQKWGGAYFKGVKVLSNYDSWVPLTKSFDYQYLDNQPQNYAFSAFVKVTNGVAEFTGVLGDHSLKSYPFGTYIKLATLPSGLSFTRDIENLGYTQQGILSTPYMNGAVYTAGVDGIITGRQKDNSIGITFSKDATFKTNYDWYVGMSQGGNMSYPTWAIYGSTGNIKI